MHTNAIYSLKSTREVAGFMDSVIDKVEEGGSGQAILDSVKNEAGTSTPKNLDFLLENLKDADQQKLLDGISEGVKVYKREHGFYPTADVAEAAMQQARTAFLGVDGSGKIFDSVTSAHHDAGSLQPNRAVVAIMALFSEAIPFAGYLPVDIGSNEGRVAILSHTSNSNAGDYSDGDLLDGTNAGGVFASSQRMVHFDTSAGTTYDSKFTTTCLDADPGYCDPAGTGVPLLRGRTTIFINGLVVAVDAINGNGATSPIAGSIKMPNGAEITITGTVTLATGAIEIVSNVALADYEVTAQSIIDFELQPALINKIGVGASVWSVYANPWRVMTGITIDASGQLRNELGLDGASEALLAIRAQMAQERHYQALEMVRRIGANNVVDWNYDYQNQIQQKIRAQILQDFAPVLANADQQMANQTMDHGITHLYAPAWFVSLCAGLPSDLFEPSGISARPSVYRAGRLFGKYDVYYSPKKVSQGADLSTSSLIAVGRSNQVARNPILLGDAVSATFMQLGLMSDLVQNAAVYGRDFTVVNPHQLSALGASRINITNMM